MNITKVCRGPSQFNACGTPKLAEPARTVVIVGPVRMDSFVRFGEETKPGDIAKSGKIKR